MTVVTIQLGQCGNQVGEQIFDTISEEVLKAPEAVQHLVYDTFFRPNYQTGTFYKRYLTIGFTR